MKDESMLIKGEGMLVVLFVVRVSIYEGNGCVKVCVEDVIAVVVC